MPELYRPQAVIVRSRELDDVYGVDTVEMLEAKLGKCGVDVAGNLESAAQLEAAMNDETSTDGKLLRGVQLTLVARRIERIVTLQNNGSNAIQNLVLAELAFTLPIAHEKGIRPDNVIFGCDPEEDKYFLEVVGGYNVSAFTPLEELRGMIRDAVDIIPVKN